METLLFIDRKAFIQINAGQSTPNPHTFQTERGILRDTLFPPQNPRQLPPQGTSQPVCLGVLLGDGFALRGFGAGTAPSRFPCLDGLGLAFASR